jgi:ribosome biogenesis GTPase
MARRLTDQQRRRIARQQDGHRDAVKHPASHSEDDAALGAEEHGLVLAHYGHKVDVENAAGQVHRCHLRANLTPLVTGDHVIVRLPTEGNAQSRGVVVARGVRQTLLERPDNRGLLRPVAANVDRLLVTIAPRPQAFSYLIDRYLVAADRAGIPAVLVCNKADLINDDADLLALLQVYRDIGYPVWILSCETGEGLDDMKQALIGHTAVVIGQSGVGKSSLVGALLPGIDIAIGALSAAEDKGRHTTTTARLYHLHDGGHLIDSPGIREFGLPPIPPGELLGHFRDLYPHAEGCRFRDCRHLHEPGCALHTAVEDGRVHTERLASYHHILASLS